MDSENYKIIAALALGTVGGLMLGNYLWGSPGKQRSLSNNLATLTKVIEQIENTHSDDSGELRERIKNILTTIESSYGDAEESSE